MVDLATRALHGSTIVTGDARAKSTAMRVLDKSDDECVSASDARADGAASSGRSSARELAIVSPVTTSSGCTLP